MHFWLQLFKAQHVTLSTSLQKLSKHLTRKCIVSCGHDPSHDVTLLRKGALNRPKKPADWNSSPITPSYTMKLSFTSNT